MNLLIDFGWITLGLIFLYYGAEWLVRGSVAIALALGIPALIVALTIVAFGTSAPELLVSLDANWRGKGDFALGNVIGSNICNLGLVLGVGALVRPITVASQLIKREMPILMLVSVVFAWMLYDGQLSRIDGAILAIGVIAYTVISIQIARHDPEAAIAATSDLPLSGSVETATELGVDETVATKTKLATKPAGRQLSIQFGIVIAGFALLVLGANRLVHGGEGVATALGVPDAIIALTLVAFGTSLPELATSVVASLKGHGDIVTGNVIGSCMFNLLAVAGITALVSPVVIVAINPINLAVMLALTFLTFPLMREGFSLNRIEGALLLLGYLGYTVWLALSTGVVAAS